MSSSTGLECVVKCEAKKGPDEVCSMILKYIKIYVLETVNVLYLLSDGCPGQNGNHTVIRFLLSLTDSGGLMK